MTTLASNQPRGIETGDNNHIPIIAAEIMYRGGAVGVVKATGHGRPLQSGDRFAGFARENCNNSAGAAADKNIDVQRRGAIQLSVSGAVITDYGQPVYATDDDTFVFSPVGAVFIGFVKRFVSAGVAVVEFDADNFQDPYLIYGAPEEYEAITGAKTLDIQDNGKVFFVTATAVVTLPAVAIGLSCAVVCMGPYGTVQISLDPAAGDSIHAPDLAGTDNKDHINTLATAQRGDLCQVVGGLVATGYNVTNQKGTWAQEA